MVENRAIKADITLKTNIVREREREKLTFRALALRQSEFVDCRLCGLCAGGWSYVIDGNMVT